MRRWSLAPSVKNRYGTPAYDRRFRVRDGKAPWETFLRVLKRAKDLGVLGVGSAGGAPQRNEGSLDTIGKNLTRRGTKL